MNPRGPTQASERGICPFPTQAPRFLSGCSTVTCWPIFPAQTELASLFTALQGHPLPPAVEFFFTRVRNVKTIPPSIVFTRHVSVATFCLFSVSLKRSLFFRWSEDFFQIAYTGCFSLATFLKLCACLCHLFFPLCS